jgi:hypothetical protein
MRPALVALLFVAACSAALLAPTAARAGGSGECRYLSQKIDHFERLEERARTLENDLWVDRIQDHLDQLRERRSQSCPGYSDSDVAARQMQQLLKFAAKGAVTFFTMGMY